MNKNTWNLIKIAKQVSKYDPLLGYELERDARTLALAVINPNARPNIESAVTVLKSLKQEFEQAIQKLDEDMDMSEFAKWFDDASDAEAEELRKILKVSSTSVAGPLDWVKNKFKKNKPQADFPPAPDMSEKEEEDFFKKGDEMGGEEPESDVQKGYKAKKQFLGDVKTLLDDMDAVKRKPSKELLQKSIYFIQQLIEQGMKVLKGGEEKAPEGPKEPKKPAGDPKGPAGKLPPKMTLQHYVSLLGDALGDENKTLEVLRDLFKEVQPALKGEDRAALAAIRKQLIPILVRVAYQIPRLRPQILPRIATLTGK